MKAIRIGICTLIAFAVLSSGGGEPWGQAILEIGAAALLALWGIIAICRRSAELYWNWLYLPLLGLGAIAAVQYALGLSVYSYLTKIELLTWGAYIVLFFLALESFRKENHQKQLVWFLVIFGFLVSLFGIIQHFTFNGELYWCVPLRSGGSPFGPFVDRDHFAGFVELTAPLGLALLLFRSRRREHVPLLLLLTIVPIGAVILSASRGGIIGLVFEIALLFFFSRGRHTEKKQLLRATAITLVAGTFIVWLGVSHAVERFDQLTHEQVTRDVRVSLYQDSWKIFIDHPWVGTGLGTLVAVYPHYASFYNGLTVDHAHNDFLELLANTGVLGGLCGLSFIGLLFWGGLTNLHLAERPFDRAILAGSTVACAGLLLHSLVDFNLHIPSNALIFLLLACLATAHANEPSSKRALSFAKILPKQTIKNLPSFIR